MKRALAIRAAVACLSACLALAAAPGAHAATLDFTGTLRIHIAAFQKPSYLGGGPAYLTVPGGGAASVNASSGGVHLSSLALPGGSFGPSTTSVGVNAASPISLVLSLDRNLTGTFSGISGQLPSGGSMGLSGLAKICLLFGPCQYTHIPLPLTPTSGGAGFGIGGTQTVTGVVAVTLRDAPWTIGQPVMTIHTPGSNVTTPSLPGGFAHGPASLTSSAAQLSGVLQLVTVSKVFTSLTSAFPEFPMAGILTLHFIPEPGTLLLFGSGVAGLALLGRRRHRR